VRPASRKKLERSLLVRLKWGQRQRSAEEEEEEEEEEKERQLSASITVRSLSSACRVALACVSLIVLVRAGTEKLLLFWPD